MLLVQLDPLHRDELQLKNRQQDRGSKKRQGEQNKKGLSAIIAGVGPELEPYTWI